jgi:hypothetical protein
LKVRVSGNAHVDIRIVTAVRTSTGLEQAWVTVRPTLVVDLIAGATRNASATPEALPESASSMTMAFIEPPALLTASVRCAIPLCLSRRCVPGRTLGRSWYPNRLKMKRKRSIEARQDLSESQKNGGSQGILFRQLDGSRRGRTVACATLADIGAEV